MAGSKKKKGGRRRAHKDLDGISSSVIQALNHSVRREILRAIAERKDAWSPIMLSKAVNEHVSITSYHVRVLRNLGVLRHTGTKQTRGAHEHFYVSLVSDNEKISSILSETEAEDRTPRKRNRPLKR